MSGFKITSGRGQGATLRTRCAASPSKVKHGGEGSRQKEEESRKRVFTNKKGIFSLHRIRKRTRPLHVEHRCKVFEKKKRNKRAGLMFRPADNTALRKTRLSGNTKINLLSGRWERGDEKKNRPASLIVGMTECTNAAKAHHIDLDNNKR